jgi:hypothetical protein
MPSPLSEAITARLDELGLTISEWKRRSKVSDVKLREMRDGLANKWTTPKERQAEAGLGWASGSFERIRQGLPPVIAVDRDGRWLSLEGLDEIDAAIVLALVDTIRSLRQ